MEVEARTEARALTAGRAERTTEVAVTVVVLGMGAVAVRKVADTPTRVGSLLHHCC